MTKRAHSTLKEMFSSGAVPTGSDFSDLIDSTLDGNAPLLLELLGGEVTRTQVLHRIDTEAQVATDDLDTINGGSDGDIIILSIREPTRVVTIKHQTGNVNLSGGSDCVLNSYYDVLALWYNSLATTYFWTELFRVTS